MGRDLTLSICTYTYDERHHPPMLSNQILENLLSRVIKIDRVIKVAYVPHVQCVHVLTFDMYLGVSPSCLRLYTEFDLQ